MPDELLVETARGFLSVDPVLGGIVVLLIGALIWREKKYFDLQRELTALQEKRLDDVKAYAAIGETVREQMRSMVETIKDRRGT